MNSLYILNENKTKFLLFMRIADRLQNIYNKMICQSLILVLALTFIQKIMQLTLNSLMLQFLLNSFVIILSLKQIIRSYNLQDHLISRSVDILSVYNHNSDCSIRPSDHKFLSVQFIHILLIFSKINSRKIMSENFHSLLR